MEASKVVRAPSLKRGRAEEADRFQLEHVMGVTVSSNAALACDPGTHWVAYPSGCTVVVYNSATCQQQQRIVNTSRKTITALAFSSDGRHLVTGECGHLPFVRVWDVQAEGGATQLAEFQGHQYGINCVAFSPSNKYVVSIGSQHDMIVNVWEWRTGAKLASNKVSTKIKGVAFAQDGSYFVTVGNRHVKFWYLENGVRSKYKEAVPLVGRAVILGAQQGQNFVGVACGRGTCADNTYVVTKGGLLCQLNNRRQLDKWLELRTTSASSITIGTKYIFVGCADGIIRCFDPTTLNFVTTLPRPHHLGVDVSAGTTIGHMSHVPQNVRYPDTVAVTYDESEQKLTAVYNDHSIYVWDVREIHRVGKSQSFLYHSACIWGIEMFPSRSEIAHYQSVPSTLLPDGCFITCSSDDTIRIWNLERNHNMGNIYSNELLRIIYMDPELTYIKDQDQTLGGSNDKVDVSYDGKNGVRCLRIRPDALHLAAGDRAGNIKVYDMRTMKEVYKIEAHDAEVLCLEYSKNESNSRGYPRLLASASRDRLIHIFNVDDHYNILETLDDHSSSITAVRFISMGEQLKMISCGADKSLIFRNLVMPPGGGTMSTENGGLFQREHNVAGKTTLYDMEVEPSGRHVVTACQDRAVRFYSTRSAHCVRAMRGTPADDGSLIKVCLSNSGQLLATSCTDKTLAVYCTGTGQLVACLSGHSELATGLKFSRNGERLLSAGGDASILLWKHETQKKPNLEEYRSSSPASSQPAVFSHDIFYDPNGSVTFTDSPLPLWAKKQLPEDTLKTSKSATSAAVDMPRGRWAQRIVDQAGITVRSVYDADSVIAFPEPAYEDEGGGGGGGSKDSSIDSGTESRNYSETSIQFKQNTSSVTSRSSAMRQASTHPHTDDSSLGSLLGGSSSVRGDTCDDSAAEHDGDVEDCSDTERHRRPSSLKLHFPETSNRDSPTEYTVNAISVDELRKSQRKSKSKRATGSELPTIIMTIPSVSGSQESDFDDDDASTPSGGDNTDKNPISLLSGSTESLDTLANRGKYLQSAFDSLSGAEQVSSAMTSTLSARHRGVTPRNTELIREARSAQQSGDMRNKREELARRIEETRVKLQSVGYKSNLKSSQSVLNLSPFPDKQQGVVKRNNGETKISLHAIDARHGDLSSVATLQHHRDFNIPANINIHHNFRHLPYFTAGCAAPQPPPATVPTSSSLYDMLINKFNEDMRHLVLQTEHDVIEPPRPLASAGTSTGGYVQEMKQRIESRNQTNRPNVLDLTVHKKHKSLPVSPVTDEAKSVAAKNYAFYIDLKNDEQENFSDDSLEECSIATNRVKKLTKRKCVSNYDITNLDNAASAPPRSSSVLMKRVVTDNNEDESILHDLALSTSKESLFEAIEPYNIYPEYERHSSASFYLRNTQVPASISQESILSNFSDSADLDEYHDEKLSRTNCNSLESILSDESSVDTQSAPLEVLFRTHRRRRVSETDQFPPAEEEQNYVQKTLKKFEPTLDHKIVTRSKSFQDGEQRIPLREYTNRTPRDYPNIPSMQTKNDQYERHASDLWANNKIIAKSKSCSFEVFFNNETENKATKSLERNKVPGSNSSSSVMRMTQSLGRNTGRAGFESLIGDIVKHKPPKGMRRGGSARVKVKQRTEGERRRNSSDTLGTLEMNLQYYEPPNKIGICEQTHDPNIPEKELEIIPSAVECPPVDYSEPKQPIPIFEPPKNSLIKDVKYLSVEDLAKFRDIERKIEMINKLVEIEEAKISKGKVKQLSRNFERLALEQLKAGQCRVKRNLSMPTITNTDNSSKRFKSRLPIKVDFLKTADKRLWPPASRASIVTRVSAGPPTTGDLHTNRTVRAQIACTHSMFDDAEDGSDIYWLH